MKGLRARQQEVGKLPCLWFGEPYWQVIKSYRLTLENHNHEPKAAVNSSTVIGIIW